MFPVALFRVIPVFELIIENRIFTMNLAFPDYCNLKKIPGLFKKKNGKFIYGDLYKMKRSGKNPTTGETLENPGLILR